VKLHTAFRLLVWYIHTKRRDLCVLEKSEKSEEIFAQSTKPAMQQGVIITNRRKWDDMTVFYLIDTSVLSTRTLRPSENRWDGPFGSTRKSVVRPGPWDTHTVRWWWWVSHRILHYPRRVSENNKTEQTACVLLLLLLFWNPGKLSFSFSLCVSTFSKGD